MPAGLALSGIRDWQFNEEIRPRADRKVQLNETQTTETEAWRSLDMDLDRLRSNHALLIQAIEIAPEEARTPASI